MPTPTTSDRSADYARAERLQTEKEDLTRRLRERDDRASELAKQVGNERSRAQKNAEKYGAEVALREAAERARAEAEQQLATLQTRFDQSAGRYAVLEAQVSGATDGQRKAQEALVTSQRTLGEVTSKLESAQGTLSRVSMLEEERDRLRLEVARLAPLLSEKEAELRAERDAMTRLKEQSEKECSRLLAEVAAARQRCDEMLREREQDRVAAAVVRGSCTMLQERCAASEARAEQEADLAAKAWREVDFLRAELDRSRDKLETLRQAQTRSTDYLSKVEAMLQEARVASPPPMRHADIRHPEHTLRRLSSGERPLSSERRLSDSSHVQGFFERAPASSLNIE
jgi:chromosome segregation protein